MAENLFGSVMSRSLEASVPASNYTLDCFVTNEVAYNDVVSWRGPRVGPRGPI